MNDKSYQLPMLPYNYNALEPVISEEQLRLHHDKHHKAYVDKANELLNKIDNSKSQRVDDSGGIYKKLTFNVGGDILHTLFWENLSNPNDQNEPTETIKSILEKEFGDIETFKFRFTETATTIDGSGWSALFFDPIVQRPLIAPIQNHNLNVYPGLPILLLLDMWEHSYYLDYQNDKKTYAQNFWKIANWDIADERFRTIRGNGK